MKKKTFILGFVLTFCGLVSVGAAFYAIVAALSLVFGEAGGGLVFLVLFICTAGGFLTVYAKYGD